MSKLHYIALVVACVVALHSLTSDAGDYNGNVVHVNELLTNSEIKKFENNYQEYDEYLPYHPTSATIYPRVIVKDSTHPLEYISGFGRTEYLKVVEFDVPKVIAGECNNIVNVYNEVVEPPKQTLYKKKHKKVIRNCK